MPTPPFSRPPSGSRARRTDLSPPESSEQSGSRHGPASWSDRRRPNQYLLPAETGSHLGRLSAAAAARVPRPFLHGRACAVTPSCNCIDINLDWNADGESGTPNKGNALHTSLNEQSRSPGRSPHRRSRRLRGCRVASRHADLNGTADRSSADRFYRSVGGSSRVESGREGRTGRGRAGDET